MNVPSTPRALKVKTIKTTKLYFCHEGFSCSLHHIMHAHFRSFPHILPGVQIELNICICLNTVRVISNYFNFSFFFQFSTFSTFQTFQLFSTLLVSIVFNLFQLFSAFKTSHAGALCISCFLLVQAR